MKEIPPAQWTIKTSLIQQILFYCCAVTAGAACLLIKQTTIEIAAWSTWLTYIIWCRDYPTQQVTQIKHKGAYWFIYLANGASYRFKLKPSTKKTRWYIHIHAHHIEPIDSNGQPEHTRISTKPLRLLDKFIHRFELWQKTGITLFKDQMNPSDWHACCVALYYYSCAFGRTHRPK